MLNPARLRAQLRRSLVVLVAAGLAACGGGDDAPKAPDSLQLLLKDGDTLPGGFLVNTVESAKMSLDRTVSVIASRAGTPVVNAVFLRHPNGNFELVLDENSPQAQGLSLTQVGQLLMSQTGEVTFKVGNRLDQEAIFYYAGGQLSLLAGTQGGGTPEGFRKLGELRMATGGLVAFTYGIDPCTIDSTTGNQRIECTLRLVAGTPGNLSPIALPNALTSQTPTSVGLEFNAQQDLLVGLPARSSDPLIGMVRQGSFQSLIERRAQFEEFGVLLSGTPRAIGSNGDVVFDAGFDTDGDGERDDERVLLYAGGGFTSIAKLHEPAGTKFVVDLRAAAIDDAGRVTFQATFNDLDQSNGPISLRQWEQGVTREIAFEGQCCFGTDEEDNELRILQIDQIRGNRRGDVVFRARLGFIEDGTENTSQRVIMHYANGSLRIVLRTGQEMSQGRIVDVATISDLSDNGDLLAIVGVDRSADRGLVLLPL